MHSSAMATPNSLDADVHLQVMSDQAQATAPLMNGTGCASPVEGDRPEPPLRGSSEQETSGEVAGRGNGAEELSGQARPAVAQDAARSSTDVPRVEVPESGDLQGRQQSASTMVNLDGRLPRETASGAGDAMTSQMGFMTPRSVTSAPGMQPSVSWLGGVEFPRWMSRLGNYLSVGHGELHPSPLAGSSGTNNSPPGGPTFVLRSPPRPVRATRTSTPPSSSDIPAEAIQAEVQRQLGGILSRLRSAEERNHDLRTQLDNEREELRRLRESQEVYPPDRRPLPVVTFEDPSQHAGDPLLLRQGARLPDPPGRLLGDHAVQPPSDPPGGLLGDLGVQDRGDAEYRGAGFQWDDPGAVRVPYGVQAGHDSGPTSTTAPATRVPAPPPPEGEQRGFLRSLLTRPRSESPPPPRPAPAHESPAIEALTRGIQQLQELQVQALQRTQGSTSEVIKPGTSTLVQLPAVSVGADTAMQFQDWLEVTSAAMLDISEQSGTWWRTLTEKVESTYKMWLSATPLERLGITPVGAEDLCTGKWTRLNARVAAMLLAAMSEEQKMDMVSHRISTNAVKIMFRLFVVYQPGGSVERNDVLKRLQNPADYVTKDTIEETLRVLRSWPRWVARCHAVNMQPPDPSVLAQGLKKMTAKYVDASPDSAFRTAMLRTSLRLDGQPNMEQVKAYQRHLQAEIEGMITSSTGLSTTTATPAPHMRALEKIQSPKNKDKSAAVQDMCRYFMKSSGCKRGARCNFSRNMSHLDRETRSKKCLLCGSESHRQKDCSVGKPQQRATTTPTTPTRDPKKQGEPLPGMASMSTASTSGTMDSTQGSEASSVVAGTPWTLETLTQAAQQVVQNQAAQKDDQSPEKTRPTMRTMVVKDIRVCAQRATSAALLDSGATHCLRSAFSEEEWLRAEEVLVTLAGGHSLRMRLSETGSLLMPPRRTASSTVAATTGQTIVPLGELVKTLGYTLVWSPNECYLYDENRQKLPLTTSAGCPQLCEAEALANKKLERLQNETATTMDRVQVAAMQMDRRWIDYLRSYVEQDNLEDGVRSLRDSPFLRDLPGECLDGLVQGGVLRDGWKVLK